MIWTSAGRGDPVTKSSEATAVGSSETFEEFYEREFPPVVGLAYALSGNRSGAEDLAQEAFLVAHRDWDRVGTYARPEVWVRRVVANLSVSVFRRRVVEAKTLARIALGYTPALPELSADDAEFWRAVRSLPRRQAQVIALYYLEDRPVAEIAEILGTAQGTVKKHLYDGRQALARRLELGEDDT
jgi:RNA polymerase sigma-70 factor (ECF subfamily)